MFYSAIVTPFWQHEPGQQKDILARERQIGEFPAWFELYLQVASKTKRGLLILNLSQEYLKSKAFSFVLKVMMCIFQTSMFGVIIYNFISCVFGAVLPRVMMEACVFLRFVGHVSWRI